MRRSGWGRKSRSMGQRIFVRARSIVPLRIPLFHAWQHTKGRSTLRPYKCNLESAKQRQIIRQQTRRSTGSPLQLRLKACETASDHKQQTRATHGSPLQLQYKACETASDHKQQTRTIRWISCIKIRVNASGQGLKTPALPVAGFKTPLRVANIGVS
jgi:hypothetical protein